MTVRRYEPEDFEQIREWGRQWGAEYVEEQFPMTGFIIDGIAAYFLYSTDSSACWLENMIMKRGIDEATKEEALGLLIDEIIKEAQFLGFTIAYATTGIISVVKRAKENGAVIQAAQFLLTKDLTTRTQ